MGRRGPGAKPATWTPPRATRRQPKLTRAEAVATFLQRLVITSGAASGNRLVLRSWQREMVDQLYAVDATGHRQIRTGVLSTARKSGKTTVTAGLALAHLSGPESVRRG